MLTQSDYDWAAHAGEHEQGGVFLADNGERMGPLQLLHGLTNGRQQIPFGTEMRVNAMRDHLGIGVRGELVAQRLEFSAQSFVVLDNAVMNDGDAIADVRVRIALGGYAMSSPPRMRNA